ncbi:hypothetical protein SeMB42_g03725 [Synchytrium endobioticum]|nr:hypothetical protein SeMB42_g03725 [Synchytrium endobioticum]
MNRLLIASPLEEIGTAQYHEPLTPKTKHIINNYHDIITSELDEFAELMDTTDYVSAKQGRRLLAIIGISDAFGCQPHADETSIVDLLQNPTSSTKYISKHQRLAISRYIAYLKGLIETRSTSIVMTEFDKLFDTQGLRRDIHNQLVDAGVWKSSPDFERQKLKVWGVANEAQFHKQISLQPNCFEYYQKAPPVLDSRDDICQEAGCRLIGDDTELLEDYRDYVSPVVTRLFELITHSTSSSGGSLGMFLKISNKNRHYILTAAHVLFPELSSIPLAKVAEFNENVAFAEYNDEHDIGLVACQNNLRHCNPLRITNPDMWENELKIGSRVMKIGQRTGITFGKLISWDASFENYIHLIEVEGEDGLPFAESGDSGSIYYGLVRGLFTPIAIHRISGDGASYGCRFLPALRAVLAKKRINFEDIQICAWTSLQDCCHTAYVIRLP